MPRRRTRDRVGLTAAFAAAWVAGAAGTARADPPVVLQKVEVSAQKEQMGNSFAGKVYNVARDAQGVTGTAAQLLATIPAVEVDVDGNVSLRGDSNVQILIDGHSSALMGANRADFLSQMPADTIERIEVTTSPSAKDKPDGTGGIINIVLKKKHGPGSSGYVSAVVGNRWRGGVTAGGNASRGPWSVFASATLKQDDRIRFASERRVVANPATGAASASDSVTTEHARMIYELGRAGFDWRIGPGDSLDETLDYSYRTMKRVSQEWFGGAGGTYERLRLDPEGERDIVSTTTYVHEFGRKDDTLTLEARGEHHDEIDTNNYADIRGSQVDPTSYELDRIFTNQPSLELKADYANTYSAAGKVQAGFDHSDDRNSEDEGDFDFNPASGLWVRNPGISNLFRLDQTVDAAYGSFRRQWGDFSAEPGLRAEVAEVKTDQATAGLAGEQRYQRLYPSLQASYEFAPGWSLEASYSERVHRPALHDLNPYAQQIDPTNVQVGNPALKPEFAHTAEIGIERRQGDASFTASIFYKRTQNGFTSVARQAGPTLVTTEENLGRNESGGAEFVASSVTVKGLTLTASADVFYNQIAAANLGFPTDRSGVSWLSKLSGDYAWSKATSLQVNASYSGRRLTPQGYQLPVFVANLGWKHDFPGRRLSAVLTVSDLFDTLASETRLSTPTLQDDFKRRRSTRVVSAGLVWKFGTSGSKKNKDETIRFDD